MIGDFTVVDGALFAGSAAVALTCPPDIDGARRGPADHMVEGEAQAAIFACPVAGAWQPTASPAHLRIARQGVQQAPIGLTGRVQIAHQYDSLPFFHPLFEDRAEGRELLGADGLAAVPGLEMNGDEVQRRPPTDRLNHDLISRLRAPMQQGLAMHDLIDDLEPAAVIEHPDPLPAAHIGPGKAPVRSERLSRLSCQPLGLGDLLKRHRRHAEILDQRHRSRPLPIMLGIIFQVERRDPHRRRATREQQRRRQQRHRRCGRQPDRPGSLLP